MSNQKDMIELIKAISGQANVLSIPRPYIEFMGSLDGGLFLSQVIFWSDRGKQADGWFYKTYAQWERELTLSKYEVGKQVKILKEKGVLETKIKKANGAPTVHYRFSFDEFQKSFVKFLNNRKSKNLTIESKETSQSLTETTTETTTENMPQSGENDFPDLFGDQSPTNEKPQNGKPELTEAEQTHLQTFGVLPDQINPDDKIYAIRQEIAADGWVIYGLDVEMGIAHFVQAMRVYHPEFIIPKDTSTRKRWYKDVGSHLQNYSLDKLASLYKRAIIKMREAKLSCWHPGSLTKWALPEVANEIAQPAQDIDLGKGFYV